jgi:hydrogenase/urease accessory protein HupE
MGAIPPGYARGAAAVGGDESSHYAKGFELPYCAQ